MKLFNPYELDAGYKLFNVNDTMSPYSIESDNKKDNVKYKYGEYKLFNSNNLAIQQSSLSSKYKSNRDYLITDEVAFNLNAYRSFAPMTVFADTYGREFVGDDYKKESTAANYVKSPNVSGIKSIFNKYGVVLLGGPGHPTNITNDDSSAVSQWRISNNVPLMDSPTTRKRLKTNSGCSIKELVKASQSGQLGRETYDYSDFMYCKHLGKVPNNYLITLRRFPKPVDDFISSIGESIRGEEDVTSNNMHSTGCMVTWLGVSGNEIDNILKYSFNMPFKEQSAEWQEIQSDADAHSQGPLNAIAAGFDESYRKNYMKGNGGQLANKYFSKLIPGLGDGPYNTGDMNRWRDKNKVYGPVDAIKSSYIRDSNGLTFQQSITINFEYELRSYDGINGRQAMLDLLSNILNVTYSTGNFWGGGFFGGGAHQNNIFTNMKIFNSNPGGFSDFVDAFAFDYNNTIKPKFGEIKDAKTFLKTSLNQLGGMLAAGFLNKLGRPEKHFYNSLLSPSPTGLWHLTIGNPHHPIMSMGNMILKNTTITHTGPLGLDDFPTGLKVTCELDRGKPRDIVGIEQMYMHGNDRIYYSMGPHIEDIYKNAIEYKESSFKKKQENKQGGVDATIGTDKNKYGTISSINKNINSLSTRFGGLNGNGITSILFTAEEMTYGASEKKSDK